MFQRCSVFGILMLSLSSVEAQLDPGDALQTMTVADGLEVITFAADPEIVSITNIDVDHRGRVWACECVNYRSNNGRRPEGDRILILEDEDGDGTCDTQKVFYQGRDIDIAMGLCVLGNRVIVSCAPHIILLEDTDGDDRADQKRILLTSDAVAQHDHSLHSFVFGPDGRFYGNFGNTGHRLKSPDGKPITDAQGRVIQDGGKPWHGGIAFRCDRDFRNFEVLGHNFRNNYELTVDSFGGVWQSDNDDDGNEAVRLSYVMTGGNYGYLDELTGERWQKNRIGQHSWKGKRHWHFNDPGSSPNVIELGNGAPTGVTVYEGRLLPPAFQNQVLFCDAGPHVTWGMNVTGDRAGFRSNPLDLLKSTDKFHRPVDVAVAPDGSVYISDWYDPVIGGFRQDDIQRGRIYRIAPPGHRSTSEKVDLSSPESAARALRSPNYCLRAQAWLAFHRFQHTGLSVLNSLLRDESPQIRARALWLIGQIEGQEEAAVLSAAEDEHPDVRVTALRIAAQTDHRLEEVITRFVNDSSPRVRAEAAVHLQYLPVERVPDPWAQLALMHTSGDRWSLEALGIGARRNWTACLEAWIAVSSRQSRPAKHEIIWRSRGTQTPALLADILENLQPEEDGARYVRAFDFQQQNARRDAALLRVALMSGLPDKLTTAAFERLPSGLVDDPNRRAELVRRLRKVPVTSGMLNLIRRSGLREAADVLLRASLEQKNELRVDALVLLLDLEQQSVIKTKLDSDDYETLAAMGEVLALSADSRSIELVVPFILNESIPTSARRRAAVALAGGATAPLVLELVKEKKLPVAIRLAVAGPLCIHRDPEIAKEAHRLFPLDPTVDARPLPPLPELVRMKGNAKSGRQMFFETGKCVTCHQLEGQGKDVGPDLSSVGTKLARSAMFESILYPSASISHNYDSFAAVTLDGQVITGLRVNENKEQIQLRQNNGLLRTLQRSDIDEIRKLEVSLMPDGLHRTMTVQQLVDLVEFLSEQRARPSPQK